MNAIAEIALGAAYGLLKTYAEHKLAHPPQSGGDPVERLCGEAGWAVSVREGETVRINFTDPAGGVRPLSIWPDENGQSVFCAASRCLPPSLPPAVSQYLLSRNPHLVVGAWVTESIPQGVAIGVLYRARLDGLSAEAFRYIGSQLILEVQDFDSKLRAAGFLT